MIYSVSGKLVLKSDHFVVIETAAGLGYKIAVSDGTLKGLPPAGAAGVKIFSYMNVRENGIELYGFLSEDELIFFEMLISVSGVGPKSALAILDVAKLDELSAAIKEDRPDLLTRASGIGRKTAERVIIELRTKVQSVKSGSVVEKMETDADLVEALSSLGYRREEARAALGKVDVKVVGVEARLKAALGILGEEEEIVSFRERLKLYKTNFDIVFATPYNEEKQIKKIQKNGNDYRIGVRKAGSG